MDFLNSWLQERHSSDTLRRLSPLERSPDGKIRTPGMDPGSFLTDFSSNDYLAFSIHPALLAAGKEALARYGSGAGAARLMSGDLQLFHGLEEQTAGLKNREAALLFGSGYLANIGVIPALVGRGDVIFSDRLNHASIYDGCRLSGARLVRFRHNDLEHLRSCLEKERGTGRALIVVESIYSMDGDLCPLREIAALKDKYSCLLMVDEAHATGVFGANGGGVIQAEGLEQEVDVVMGTYGKALGSYGAYVAGSRLLKEYLINRARSFIYATGLPPAVAACSLAAVRLVGKEPDTRRQLLENSAFFKQCLQQEGLVGEPGISQIVPVMVGESRQAMAMAAELRDAGLFVTAVRPPTVPEGTARLRFSVTLH
ncbi:MAG: 8-amino-7-oxononanoate synthase, partial [Thermodesulfobacteriota bacterium]